MKIQEYFFAGVLLPCFCDAFRQRLLVTAYSRFPSLYSGTLIHASPSSYRLSFAFYWLGVHQRVHCHTVLAS